MLSPNSPVSRRRSSPHYRRATPSKFEHSIVVRERVALADRSRASYGRRKARGSAVPAGKPSRASSKPPRRDDARPRGQPSSCALPSPTAQNKPLLKTRTLPRRIGPRHVRHRTRCSIPPRTKGTSPQHPRAPKKKSDKKRRILEQRNRCDSLPSLIEHRSESPGSAYGHLLHARGILSEASRRRLQHVLAADASA